MHSSIEDMIEKYRRELMDFAMQNSEHNVEAELDYNEVIPTMATPEEQSVNAAIQTQAAAQPQVDPYLRVPRSPVPATVPRKYKDYEDFIARNPSSGLLKVQVFAADESFPISNAFVEVTTNLEDGERTMFTGYTDIDGIIDNIRLPAPSSSFSLNENNTTEPYSLYNITVSHPNFSKAQYENAPVFDSIKSVQPVELVPLTDNQKEPGMNIYTQQPMTLFGGET
ncbi:MAG: hypothetical protein PUB20_02430 [Clostridia bacterium]|nr:hypothetical protein [Clostridia bacterium]